jgi:integrase
MARTTAPLTDTACRTAKPREREYKLFDGDGLYLLVQPNGRKGWRLRYLKPDGREGLTALGSYPVVGLGSARRERFEIKQQLANGIDPIQSKQRAKTQAVINGRTFESVALDWHASMVPRWAPGHAKTVLSRLKTHVFPILGARAIVDLDTHDLMQPLEAVTKRGTIDVALRIKNYLQSIMREATRLRLITANPAHDLDGSIKMPRVSHRPALPLSRLPELQARIDGYKGRPLTRLTVMLSLHVFVRSSELRFVRWNEFDLVFAGDAKPWKPMSENTVNAALRTIGYDTKADICGHGFRAMAYIALVESGLWSETAIEQQMSHKERNNVRTAYTHKAEFLEERRMIMTWWSRFLEANREDHMTPHEFATQTGENVTRLRSAKKTE